MGRKTLSVIIGLIIIAILIIVGYEVFHKTPKVNTLPAKVSTSSSKSSSSSPAVATHYNAVDGYFLASANGYTLYTYSGDKTDVSNCTGSCLASWPAYVDDGSTKKLPADVGTFKRSDDGKTQYTYNGLPLYTFTGDSAAGQVAGNGVSGFSVVKVSAS